MAGDGLDGDVLLDDLHLHRCSQGRFCPGDILITTALRKLSDSYSYREVKSHLTSTLLHAVGKGKRQTLRYF